MSFPTRESKTDELILVLGSTGFVGTRLVNRLLVDGYKVRVTYRNLKKLDKKSWSNHPNLEKVYCDILDYENSTGIVEGVSYVYYLIHSMDTGESEEYKSLDIKAARNMVRMSANGTIRKLVYLGGLGNDTEDLSTHLQSRNKVGEVLRTSSCDVIILRAAIILGSGSASFEIMRYLVDRLPIMITPKWTHSTISQPIGVRNVIEYLVGAIEVEALRDGIYDIGGPDVLTYNNMMQILAEENGLRKRLIVPVPLLTPKLSARWVRLVTPVNEKVATRLVDGLRNDAICLNDDIKKFIPQKLYSVRKSIKTALHEKEYTLMRDTYGHPSQEPPVEWSQPGDPSYAGGTMYYDRRAVIAKGKISDVWEKIISIGGDNGWYYMDSLWKFRGFIDELIGGPGIRRGRPSVKRIEVGDYIDCWKVTSIVQNRELTLRAEMKIFGIGTLKFKIYPDDSIDDQFIVEQYASYVPQGLAGILYWKVVAPLHNKVFYGMLREIVRKSDCQIIIGPKILSAKRYIRTHRPYIRNIKSA